MYRYIEKWKREKHGCTLVSILATFCYSALIGRNVTYYIYVSSVVISV